VEEIAAAATVMREKAPMVAIKEDIILDTCGTGGDGYSSINISTAVSIVAAAAGVTVAKHGNRSVTSEAGSADVLEALGVNIDMVQEKAEKMIDDIQIGFLFAPSYHKAMKFAGGVRRELGVRTIFNMLGPIINPARNTHHLMGVFSEDLTEKIAGVMKRMGVKHSAVVCGAGNMDEISIAGKTRISELRNGKIKTYYIKPSDFGIKEAPYEAIRGGKADQNAKILLSVFKGEDRSAYRDVIVLNSGVALYIADKVKSIKEGVALAAQMIDSGKAMKKLKEFMEYSNKK